MVCIVFGLFFNNQLPINVRLFFIIYWKIPSFPIIIFAHLIDSGKAQYASLSIARYSLVAASTINKVIFAGGIPTGTVVDIYDVPTGTWNSTATGAGQLSVGRTWLAGGATGNKIIFAGGMYVDIYTQYHSYNP